MAIEQTVQKVSSVHVRVNLTIRDSYDLLLLAALALLLPSLVLMPIPLLRVPLGLIGAMLAPGYALVAALFPRRDDLDGVARAALSFGLSVAVLPMLALVLNALPWGIRPWPMALALSLWMWLLSGLALLRRHSVATSGAAYVPSIADPGGWWCGLSDRVKTGYAIGALVLTGVIIGVVLIVAAISLLIVHPTAHLTELYALGADGLAENYPRELALDQVIQVQLGIHNREGATARYRVEVRADGQLLAQAGPLMLENDATWSDSLRFTPPRAGDDQRISIFLYRDDDVKPYRQLWLWLNVRP